MSNNVVLIADYRETCFRAVPQHSASATIISLPTAKERKLAHKMEAGRQFAAAETIAEMDASAQRPAEIMLRLSLDPDAGEYSEKAATWLWRKYKTEVIGADARPVSKALRRYRSR